MKQYKIIFGTEYDKEGYKMDNSDVLSVVDCATNKLAKNYGGVTKENYIGSWKDERGHIIHEYVKALLVVDTEDKGDVGIKAVAQFIKVALNQSSVMIVSENVDAKFI